MADTYMLNEPPFFFLAFCWHTRYDAQLHKGLCVYVCMCHANSHGTGVAAMNLTIFVCFFTHTFTMTSESMCACLCVVLCFHRLTGGEKRCTVARGTQKKSSTPFTYMSIPSYTGYSHIRSSYLWCPTVKVIYCIQGLFLTNPKSFQLTNTPSWGNVWRFFTLLSLKFSGVLS